MNQVTENFSEIVSMIEYRKYNAYRKANEELISLYWDFGKYVSERLKDSKSDIKFIISLENFLKSKYSYCRAIGATDKLDE